MIVIISCLQETWLAKQQLAGLNNMHVGFHGIGESTTDFNNKMIDGLVPDGVAILWNTMHEHLITEIRLDVDWAVGILVSGNDKKFAVINVYMPYEATFNENEFLQRIWYVKSFIEELPTTSVYVVGDYNADISDTGSLFSNYLQQFGSDNDLILSTKNLLQEDSLTFTYEGRLKSFASRIEGIIQHALSMSIS